MAKVAKRDGVTVWVEIDGRKIGVSPNTPTAPEPKKFELPDDFAL